MTDTTSTDVAVIDDDATVARKFNTADAIQALASGRATVFSTMTGDDFDTKLALLDAVTNSAAIADNLGKTIRLVNVVVQTVEMPDEQTGELQELPRTILIAEDGTAYHAISMGIFRAVETVLGVVGQPSTWPSPLNIQVTREGKAPRAYYTIRPVKAKK
jgi:hypothetical protein